MPRANYKTRHNCKYGGFYFLQSMGIQPSFIGKGSAISLMTGQGKTSVLLALYMTEGRVFIQMWHKKKGKREYRIPFLNFKLTTFIIN